MAKVVTKDGVEVMKFKVAATGRDVVLILDGLKQKGLTGALEVDGVTLLAGDLVNPGDTLTFVPLSVPHGISESVGKRRRPPRPDLVNLLRQRRLPRGRSREEVFKWIEDAPIPFETVRFLKAHIFDVKDDFFVANARSLSETPVLLRRMDYRALLLDKANRGAKVVVLSGRRRQGKTCALATEMLHIRYEKSGVKDRAIFYHSGEQDVPPTSRDNIVLLLSFMGIGACWDEFPNIDQDLGMAYKLIVEDGTVALDGFSVLLWGSREIDVREKGALLSGLQSRGVFRAKLPDPSIDVVLGMYYMSAGAMKLLQGSPEAFTPMKSLWDPETFIRKFLVCGYNLADYAGGRTFKDTLYDGVDEVSALSGSKLAAVRRIVVDHSSTVAVDAYSLSEVQSANILRCRPNSKSPKCDFLDPQLLLCADLNGKVVSDITEEQVKTVEGHLFEVMVRSDNLLLPLLAAEISPILDVTVEQVLCCSKAMYYGNIIPDVECEIDGMMSCGEWAIVCSMKRNASQEKWHGENGLKAKLEIAWESCLSAKEKMKASPTGKSRKYVLLNGGQLHPGEVLTEAKQILYLALSVIDEEPATSWEGIYFKNKPVTRLKLNLWDLVKGIEVKVPKLWQEGFEENVGRSTKNIPTLQ